LRHSSPDPRRPSLTTAELIAMVGGLMALNALSIDILLPALGEIGAALGAPGNDRQLVITAYVFGFGLAQLGFGPLSDALGRRRVLLYAWWPISLRPFFASSPGT
jgi:DHA1 family bicyclomycin/chloramphenicol resistance-like MFS transporter